MHRKLFFAYGVACHVLFLGVYVWMAFFIGNLAWAGIPTLDGPRRLSLPAAVSIDTLLIALFAVQHSVMARPAFKRWWTRFVPTPVERSTYVLASSLAVILLMWQWQPIGGVVWDIQHPTLRLLVNGLFLLGWLLVPAVTFLINHFDLFGLRQVWLYLKGREYTNLRFRTPGLYRFVRHPLYVGWLVLFWATPTMTMTHLLFAGLMTAYILVAIPFEERDLIAHFGSEYVRYRQRVGGLLPRLTAPAAPSEPHTQGETV